MRLTPLSPDSDVQVLRLAKREVATLEHAAVVVLDLTNLRYPGAADVLAWLRQVLDEQR